MNGGAGLNYDAAGDVTQDPLNSYLYDAEGRLCAAKTAGPSYTGYVYDASGIRVAKGTLASFSCNFATNGFTPTASYVLGPGGEQVTEYAVSGPAGNYASTWVHTNAFSGGKIQATYHDTGTYFYLGDWLGTKRAEVGQMLNANNTAQLCAAAFTSLPYGDGLTTVALPGYSSCIDATEHHFTGKERDNESGNDYFEARYYASSMGRFMSPDWSAKEEPIPYAKMDDPQTLNLYAYLINNPLAGVDADGHGPQDFPCDEIIVEQLVTQPTYQRGVLTTDHGIKVTATGFVGSIKDTVTRHGDELNNVKVEETNKTTQSINGEKPKPIQPVEGSGKTNYGEVQDNITTLAPTSGPHAHSDAQIDAGFKSNTTDTSDTQALKLTQIGGKVCYAVMPTRTLSTNGLNGTLTPKKPGIVHATDKKPADAP